MRTCFAFILISWVAMAAAPGNDKEVSQLKAEFRAMRTQMGLMQQRLDALSARRRRARARAVSRLPPRSSR